MRTALEYALEPAERGSDGRRTRARRRSTGHATGRESKARTIRESANECESQPVCAVLIYLFIYAPETVWSDRCIARPRAARDGVLVLLLVPFPARRLPCDDIRRRPSHCSATHTHTHTHTQHTTHTHDTSARPFRPPPQAHERARSPPPTRTDDTRCGGAARSPPCPAPPRFLGCRMPPATSRIGPRAPAPMPATLTHRWPHVLLLRLLRHAGRVEGARRGRPSQQSRHTAAQPASPFSLPTPSQRPLVFPARASSTAAAAARDRDRALRRDRRPFSAAAASTA